MSGAELLSGKVLLEASNPVPEGSAVLGTPAVLETGASVAVSPPPQAAATVATAKTAASSNVCDLRFWMFSSYCEEIASRR